MPLLLQDRQIAHISFWSETERARLSPSPEEEYKPEPQQFPPSVGSYFVMAQGCEMQADSFSVKGTFAAVVNEGFQIKGSYVVAHTLGYRSTEQRFSVLSETPMGNLSYIDGCSNTNLIDPARNGEACLNYLFFPHGIKQTHHTHPSYRIGFVLSGRGLADIGPGEEAVPLVAGSAFILGRHTRHRFRTPPDQSMSLMVFHPDSEDGPRDQANPMRTRTYLSG